MTEVYTETGSPNGGPTPWDYVHRIGTDGKKNPDGSTKYNVYAATHRHVNYASLNGDWNYGYDDVIAPVLKDPNLYMKTVDALIGKINGVQLNVANDIATCNQTISLVTNTARKLVSCVRNCKRGNLFAAMKALGVQPPRNSRSLHGRSKMPGLVISPDEAASLWLELQYGWKPLLSDVYDVATIMANRNDAARKWTARARKSYSQRKVTGVSNWLVNISDCSESYTIIARGVESMPTPRSLGLTDPLSVAWEVLPWSFVVDWFLPIGNYLNALNQLPGFNCTYETLHREHNYRVTGYGYHVSSTPGNVYATEDYYQREPSSTLEAKLPRLKPFSQALSLAHMENALALLTTAISRK